MTGFDVTAGLGLAAGAAFLLNYGAPVWIRRYETAKLLECCSRSRSLVLTFDDGPGRELTPAILALLRQFEAPATFFLLGDRAAAAPDVVERIIDAGCEIACHGQSHPHAWRTWPWSIWKDVREGYRSMNRWIGPDAAFRPPFGKTLLPVIWRLRRRGTPLGWWTIDSGDTWDALPSADRTVDALRRAGGGVALLHDFDRGGDARTSRHAYVLQTTERLLRLARAEGYRVCGLRQLLNETRSHPAPAAASARRERQPA